jgi:tetratricopeptide (TPR) repeat protein
MMAPKAQQVKSQSDTKLRRGLTPTVAEDTDPDLVEGVRFPEDHTAQVGDSSVERQAAQLGDPRLLRAQRQGLAARIGRLQGNRHLQKVVDVLRARPLEAESPFSSERGLEDSADRSAAAGVGSPALDGRQALAASPADPALQRQTRQGAGAPAQADTQVSVDQIRPMFMEAQDLYLAGQYRRAIILFERIRQLPGISEEWRRDSLWNIGRCNLKLKRYATAIIYLEEYVTMPGAAVMEAEPLLREAKRGAGVPVEGVGTGRAAAAGGVMDQAKAVFREGVSLYRQGRFRAAIIRFERLRQMQGLPASVPRACLFNIGRCNLRLRRYATAIVYLEKYLSTPGADRGAGETLLGEARQGAGAPAQADTQVSEDQLKQMFMEAQDLYLAGQFRRAIIIFERMRQAPGFPEEWRREWLWNIGRCNLKLKRYATAIIYLEEFLAMPGTGVEEGEALLREAKRGAGVPVEAIGTGRAAGAGGVMDQAKAVFREGVSLYRQGRFGAAIIRFERLRQMQGLPASVPRACLFNIGRCNLRLRRYSTAIVYLEKYLSTPGADRGAGETLLGEARQGAEAPAQAR